MPTVVLKISGGDWATGFILTCEIRRSRSLPFVSNLCYQTRLRLPPAPEIAREYNAWKATYLQADPSLHPNRLMTADQSVSVGGKRPLPLGEAREQAARKLQRLINRWLNTPALQPLRAAFTRYLPLGKTYQFSIQTDHRILQSLPWWGWDLLQPYTGSTLVISTLKSPQQIRRRTLGNAPPPEPTNQSSGFSVSTPGGRAARVGGLRPFSFLGQVNYDLSSGFSTLLQGIQWAIVGFLGGLAGTLFAFFIVYWSPTFSWINFFFIKTHITTLLPFLSQLHPPLFVFILAGCGTIYCLLMGAVGDRASATWTAVSVAGLGYGLAWWSWSLPWLKTPALAITLFSAITAAALSLGLTWNTLSLGRSLLHSLSVALMTHLLFRFHLLPLGAVKLLLPAAKLIVPPATPALFWASAAFFAYLGALNMLGFYGSQLFINALPLRTFPTGSRR